MEDKWKNYKSYDEQKYGKRLEPADLPQAKRVTNERSTYALLCDVCKDGNRRVAVTINDVKICHDCLNFLQNLSKQNKRSFLYEIYYQVNYIKKTEGFANFA